MVSCYVVSQNEFVPADNTEQAVWIHLTAFNKEECSILADQLEVPLSFLMAAYDPVEYPRFEMAGQIMLIIVRAPVEVVRKGAPVSTVSLAIIITDNRVITACTSPEVLTEFRDKLHVKEGLRPHIFLAFQLLLFISKRFIHYLTDLDEQMNQVEAELNKSMQNNGLINLMHLEKALIYFLTALKANQLIQEKLLHVEEWKLHHAERELLQDGYIENRQAANTAEVFSQIIGSLGDTLGTIVNNNVNKTMKFLTGVTIILMIPTIFAGVYGMNIALPMQSSSWAFIALSVLCIAICWILWVVFRRKDWI